MALIPFDDRDGLIWFNGRLLPWREAKLHVLSHGLHYGRSVFEGERVYNGRVFKLTEHSRRLEASSRILGISMPYSVAEIDEATREVIRANNIVDGYVRPIAWAGSEMMGVSAQKNTINVAIATWEWPSYFDAETKMKGIRLKWADWCRPAPTSAPVHSKCSGLYMICTMSKHAAEAEGYDDALMLDWRGQVAESTGANVFFVYGDELHTPTPDCFLDGITRRTAIDLATARGFKVIERAISKEEIASADEVFLTGTAAEITPVGEIEGMRYTPGRVCGALIEDFNAYVRRADSEDPAKPEPVAAIAAE